MAPQSQAVVAFVSGVHRSCRRQRSLRISVDDRRLFGVKINCFFAFGFIACGVAACSVGPDYRAPEPPMPASFIAAASSKVASSRAVSSTKWWRTLHDRELNSLIDRAIAGSPTLEIALNRIQQARAQEAVIVGTALPEAGASEGGALGTGSDLARVARVAAARLRRKRRGFHAR